jgi:hypothetical protein
VIKRCLGVSVVVLSVLLLMPLVAGAQSIGGTVTDNTGGVLPGVTVEARSPALIEQVRTVVTDGSGQYLVVGLESGVYTVTFTLPGFSTVLREGIELQTGFTANVDAQLQVGSVAETITVSGASPIVDVQSVNEQAVMNREIIDAVPTGKSFQNLGILIPGMIAGGVSGSAITQDVGGTAGQNYMTLAIHGGDGSDQSVQIDGMAVETMIREDTSLLAASDGNYSEFALDYSASASDVETGGVRVNMIPRAGGNNFAGEVFTSFSGEALQSENIDDDLIAAGLSEPNRVKELWTFNPSLGGPIVQDRLWFFSSFTRYRTDQFVAGAFHAVDPSAFVYVPDLNRQAVDDQVARDTSLRLTWQATSRDKFSVYVNNSLVNRDHLFVGNVISSANITPAAALASSIDDNVYQVTWTSPVTSRLLFEFGASMLDDRWLRNPAPEADTTVPGIFEIAGGIGSRNQAAVLGITHGQNGGPLWAFRGAASYVTGSHALKFGFTLNRGENDIDRRNSADNLRYFTLFGEPLIAEFYGNPNFSTNKLPANLGIYAQDQWTVDRLTVNAGVRFDYFNNAYPDHIIPPTQWVPVERNFPGQTVVTWKDIQPRLGAVYDLFGDGRTAIKVSASRYGDKEGVGFSSAINPASNNNSVRRAWVDLNGDFFPQGDPGNPEANGELVLPSPNRQFGQAIITEFYDPEWAFGWGKRHANWEFSTSVQHEVLPRVSIDVGYFHRAFVNFETVDNRANGAGDFDTFSVTAPLDPRLPGGGGYVVNGFVDPIPAVAGITDELTVSADNFGGESRTWNGVDIGVNARIEDLLLQGGLSTGKTTENNCGLVTQLPELLIDRGDYSPSDFCDTSTPFLTQVKFLGSYTLPYEVQIAATFQTLPGIERNAEVEYTSAQVGASLGRPLATRRSVTIDVLEPGTSYGERLVQLDLRLTKILNFAGSRVRAMFDMYNIFNENAVLEEIGSFDANWLSPRAILPGRLLKFAFQFDF